jgi:hypothetical protein
LGAAGRAVWRRHWKFAKAWISIADAGLVERVARLSDAADLLETTIKAEGLVHRNRTKRSFVHPMFNSLLGLYSRIDAAEALLACTPVDRARLHVEPEAEDPLDAWVDESIG